VPAPAPSPDALDGVTVLDLTNWVAGPYATKMLADLGARVLKVERPGGDPARSLEPFLGDQPGPDRSATFQFLNANKEGLVIDLAQDAGRNLLYQLVRRADLVVTSSSPKVEAALGIDYASLQPHGDPAVLSITNFGHRGPYRDYRLSETVLYAMGGEMFGHGLASREPLKLGGTAALLQCGAMAGIAAMGAITAREVHGIGHLAEVSLFESQLASVDRRSSAILGYRFSGRVLERPAGASSGIAGGVYPVADGYVEVTASGGSYWDRFVEMVGDDQLRDSKWTNPATSRDPSAKEEADAVIYPWMLTHTRGEVWERAREAHAMVAPYFTGIDVANDPVFRERGLWTEIEHPELGNLPMLGRPYMFEKTPWRLRRPAPVLGQDTDSVLAWAGVASDEIALLRAKRVIA
jgi:crotonobetainyl-CoA:carnitine CoA-transferase CaiB-like acyl-CoA transferase